MKYVLSSALKYFLRLLALPFVLGIVLIKQISTLITISWHFLLYGGELVRYNKETNQKTLYEVYCKLDECLRDESDF